MPLSRRLRPLFFAAILILGIVAGAAVFFSAQWRGNQESRVRYVNAGDETAFLRAALDVQYDRADTLYLNADLPPETVASLPAEDRTYVFNDRPRFDINVDTYSYLGRNVTIWGNHSIWQQTGDQRLIYVFSGQRVEVHNVTLAGADFTRQPDPANGRRWGAAVYVDTEGTLALYDSVITGNRALNGGGGLYNRGRAELTRVTISENTAAAGGGLYNDYGGQLIGTCLRIVGNIATDPDGVGFVNGGNENSAAYVRLRSSLIEGNRLSDDEDTTATPVRLTQAFNRQPDVLVDLRENGWNGLPLVGNLPDAAAISTDPVLETDPTMPGENGQYANPACAPGAAVGS